MKQKENGRKSTSAPVILYTGIKSIPYFERRLYWVTFIGFICYAAWRFYHIGKESRQFLPNTKFSSGWLWLGAEVKDIADSEWETFSKMAWNSLPWMFAHTFIARMIKKLFGSSCIRLILPLFYSMYTLSFLFYRFGKVSAYIFITQALFGYIMIEFGNIWILWISNLGLVYLMSYSHPYVYGAKYYLVTELPDRMANILLVLWSWTCFRILSFGLDCRSNGKDRKSNYVIDFIHYFAYLFYFPTGIFGPLITFESFEKDMLHEYEPWTKAKVSQFIAKFISYIFWFFIYDLILHFFYVFSVKQPFIMGKWDIWELSGTIYLTAIMFSLKYHIFYGISSLFGQVEGFTTPNTPMCLARLDFTSRLWRDFDRGLYAFLLKYIYIPLMGNSRTPCRKVIVSAVCFTYVYLWHGTSENILFWAVINFILVNLETCLSSTFTLPLFKFFQKKMSASFTQRVSSLQCIILTLSYIIANQFFLSGTSIAIIYIQALSQASSLNILCLCGFFYCCYQINCEVKSGSTSMKNFKKL